MALYRQSKEERSIPRVLYKSKNWIVPNRHSPICKGFCRGAPPQSELREVSCKIYPILHGAPRYNAICIIMKNGTASSCVPGLQSRLGRVERDHNPTFPCLFLGNVHSWCTQREGSLETLRVEKALYAFSHKLCTRDNPSLNWTCCSLTVDKQGLGTMRLTQYQTGDLLLV